MQPPQNTPTSTIDVFHTQKQPKTSTIVEVKEHTDQHTSTNVELQPPKDHRISTIVEQRLNGKTWSAIAEDLDINRKTLYDIRQKDEYYQFFHDTIYPKALKRLNDILDDMDTSDYKLMRAIDEALKHQRAYIPKRFESKSLHIEAQVDLDKRRELNQELMSRLDEGTREKIRAVLLELGDGQES